MTLIIFLIIALIMVIVVQIGKIADIKGALDGEGEIPMNGNDRQGVYFVIFLVCFMVFCVVSAYYYRNWMLGYGPHDSASEHGVALDALFNTTLIFTGIVFVLTHIALFWFCQVYKYKKGRKALFLPHNNTLELFWTAIPAAVMCFLVVKGLTVWNEVMADTNEEYMEIEAMGQQFNWMIRYPGGDNLLGERNYKLIDGNDPFGQNWEDKKNLDDFHPSEIVLPVNQTIRVRITAKDVLHNFDLPHFRVKMDAIPGLPTYFVFKPTITTEEYREKLRNVPEYQALADPTDPESPMLWEAFDYELACAELCGYGHYSMRRVVRIVSQEEYDAWEQSQDSWYNQSVKGTDQDPYKAKSDEELRLQKISMQKDAFMKSFNTVEAGQNIRLDNVKFKSGLAELEPDSKYELNNLIEILTSTYPKMKVELAGHTDNVGNPASNQTLSQARATAVKNYLIENGQIAANRLRAVGYGITKPAATNDTAEGRQENRRTECIIISN